MDNPSPIPALDGKRPNAWFSNSLKSGKILDISLTNNMKKREIRQRESFVTTLRRLYDYAAEHFPEMPANEQLDGDQKYTYAELTKKSAELSELMAEYGLGAGSRVAILSKNMPNWSVAFFAVTAFGRIAVPILEESTEGEIKNILEHSETQAIFVSDAAIHKVPQECLDSMKMVFSLDSLAQTGGTAVKQQEKARTSIPEPDDLAGLFYTSGTTGKAKGVMLSHGNLAQNIIAAWYTQVFKGGERWLSILPMAHTYEMAFSLLYPYYVGGCVYYLKKAPTVSVLTDALQRVKPHVVNSVPLIIEKIYRSSVRKTVNNSLVLSWMDKHMQRFLCLMIGRKLKKFFGGKIMFFGIGGAKLDPIVEDFLIKARFPYAIGYGLTETAPLVCQAPVRRGRVGSIGWHSKNVQVRLGNVNPSTGEGEIQCKGPNVMLGYYKDPEKTASVFTEDGWFRTGDLAVVDKTGYYYIKGRLGSMIVGASGENIYPEEIESVINNFSGVEESVVVSRHGKLVAMVKFDPKVLDWDQEKEDRFLQTVEEKRKAVLDFVNERVRKSNNINEVEIVKENFVKTATSKIRRFLYQEKNQVNKNDASGK